MTESVYMPPSEEETKRLDREEHERTIKVFNEELRRRFYGLDLPVRVVDSAGVVHEFPMEIQPAWNWLGWDRRDGYTVITRSFVSFDEDDQPVVLRDCPIAEFLNPISVKYIEASTPDEVLYQSPP